MGIRWTLGDQTSLSEAFVTSATELPEMCLPVAYVVRIRGVPSDVWVGQHAALTITVSRNRTRPATTSLRGTLKDQAHLMGLLMELYDLGYPILSVKYLPAQDTPEQRTNLAVVR
jgi:hypothetical protein